MKNKMMYGVAVFTFLLSLFGFFQLINSVENGKNSANEYLNVSMGGSMDAEDFRVITEGYIFSNITLGGIMLLVGLSFFCYSLYKLIK